MAESPTPNQDTKGDGLHLPEIERSDSKAEIKGHQEEKKEPQREERKKSAEAPRKDDTESVDDHRYDDKDDRSPSETKAQTNNTPTTTKEPQHKTSTSPIESTERSPARKGENQSDEETKNTKTSDTRKSDSDTETKNTKKSVKFGESDSETEDKNTKRSVKFEENPSTKEDSKQESNESKNETKLNLKGGESKKDSNTTSGGVVKSPRREEEKKGENRKSKEQEPEEGKEREKEKSGDMSSRSSASEMSDGRCKQREFFKMELQRLETGLKRESSKIIEPEKKPYTPFTFNTLEPYYNTRMTRFLIELPDEMKHGHTSRKTAQGLTDPWIDLKMDRDILPKVASKPVSRQVAILKKEKELRERKKRSALNQSSTSRKEGSTRLPKFPMVQMETQDLASRQLTYHHVPTLRNELKTKYSSSARTKIDEDYKRTHADFYRMELDKLDEVHPINRGHMKSAYFAYLQNTPGSKKAINECVRGLKSGKAQ